MVLLEDPSIWFAQIPPTKSWFINRPLPDFKLMLLSQNVLWLPLSAWVLPFYVVVAFVSITTIYVAASVPCHVDNNVQHAVDPIKSSWYQWTHKMNVFRFTLQLGILFHFFIHLYNI